MCAAEGSVPSHRAEAASDGEEGSTSDGRNVSNEGESMETEAGAAAVVDNSMRVLKLKKRGIIYLSSIPPLMTVAKVRDIFGQYGELGRVYLQLNKSMT